MTSLVAFLGFRERRYGLAICAGFLAGLCRPIGMLLAIPAAIEAGRELALGAARASASSAIATVLAAPAGAAAYLGWVQVTVGSFLLPLREQLSRSHRGAIADPFVTFARDVRDLVHGDAPRHGRARSVGGAARAARAFILWKLPASYGWYAVATLAVALTASNLDSLERYGLGCFPFVIAAAMLTRGRQHLSGP